MSDITSLEELYVAQLKDIYYAEKQLTKAIPKMAKKATDPNLAKGFTMHAKQTEEHVARLENIFGMLDMKPKAEKCEAITGLLEEAKELMDESEKGSVLDAALIMAAQKVEHYEIGTYGTLCIWAKTLGFADQVVLLKKTIAEEKDADTSLTKAAEGGINKKAVTQDNAKTTKKAA